MCSEKTGLRPDSSTKLVVGSPVRVRGSRSVWETTVRKLTGLSEKESSTLLSRKSRVTNIFMRLTLLPFRYCKSLEYPFRLEAFIELYTWYSFKVFWEIERVIQYFSVCTTFHPGFGHTSCLLFYFYFIPTAPSLSLFFSFTRKEDPRDVRKSLKQRILLPFYESKGLVGIPE